MLQTLKAPTDRPLQQVRSPEPRTQAARRAWEGANRQEPWSGAREQRASFMYPW